jgi:hypothetical protein
MSFLVVAQARWRPLCSTKWRTLKRKNKNRSFTGLSSSLTTTMLLPPLAPLPPLHCSVSSKRRRMV